MNFHFSRDIILIVFWVHVSRIISSLLFSFNFFQFGSTSSVLLDLMKYPLKTAYKLNAVSFYCGYMALSGLGLRSLGRKE